MQNSAADTWTVPSPANFAEIGDTEWPFSKLCLDGW